MHIAYVTDQLLPQTATDTEQLVTMCSSFGEAGCEITIVNPSHWFQKDPTPAEIAQYYHVEPTFNVRSLKGAVPFIRGIEKLLHALVAAIRLKNEVDIDVVYTRNLPVILAFLLFSSKKLVYENYRPWPDQNLFMKQLFKWLQKKQSVQALVLHSKLAADSYKKIGFSDDRILVAHNGVALDRFGESISMRKARKELGWDLNKTITTYTGRVNTDKGLDLMLDLAAEYPALEFVIVGSEQQGAIEQQAAKYGNVKVYPWQSLDELPKFLFASDILFIPPTAKPLKEVGNTVLPMKTFLYMAAGRVILGPKTADIEEVLRDGHNAALVKPDDQISLKQRFEELVSDQSLRRKLGQKAKCDSRGYSWVKRAEKILNYIS